MSDRLPTLVEQLQHQAMDPNIRVSDLLRRVKFTATKLGLGKIEDWVESEQNGWSGKPPDYRVMHGRVMGHHPYSGSQELRGAFDWMTRRANNQAISAIEAMLAQAKPNTTANISFPAEIENVLNEKNGPGWGYTLAIPMSELSRVLDTVRNLVLDWALNLEKAGIMGSDMNFDDKEKAKAQAASTIINIGSIGSMAGNIGQGNVSGDNSVSHAQLQPILEQLKPAIDTLVAAGADGNLLSSRIEALEAALTEKQPNTSLVRGLVTDLRNTLTGAAGNLIATGAISALNAFLGTGVPAP